MDSQIPGEIMFKFFTELLGKLSGKKSEIVIVKFDDETFGVKRGHYFAEYLDAESYEFQSGDSGKTIFRNCRFKTIKEAEAGLAGYIDYTDYLKKVSTFGDNQEIVKKL